MNKNNPYQTPSQKPEETKPRRPRRTRISVFWIGLLFFVGGIAASSSIDEQTTGDVKRLVYLISGSLRFIGVTIMLFAGVMAFLRMISGGRIR